MSSHKYRFCLKCLLGRTFFFLASVFTSSVKILHMWIHSEIIKSSNSNKWKHCVGYTLYQMWSSFSRDSKSDCIFLSLWSSKHFKITTKRKQTHTHTHPYAADYVVCRNEKDTRQPNATNCKSLATATAATRFMNRLHCCCCLLSRAVVDWFGSIRFVLFHFTFLSFYFVRSFFQSLLHFNSSDQRFTHTRTHTWSLCRHSECCVYDVRCFFCSFLFRWCCYHRRLQRCHCCRCRRRRRFIRYCCCCLSFFRCWLIFAFQPLPSFVFLLHCFCILRLPFINWYCASFYLHMCTRIHTHVTNSMHLFALHKCMFYSKLVVQSISAAFPEWDWISEILAFGWKILYIYKKKQTNAVMLLAKKANERRIKEIQWNVRDRLCTSHTCMHTLYEKCFSSHTHTVIRIGRQRKKFKCHVLQLSLFFHCHVVDILKSSCPKRISSATRLQMNLFAESVCYFGPHKSFCFQCEIEKNERYIFISLNFLVKRKKKMKIFILIFWRFFSKFHSLHSLYSKTNSSLFVFFFRYTLAKLLAMFHWFFLVFRNRCSCQLWFE